MAVSNKIKPKKIGVIAEEHNDIDVFEQLTNKLVAYNRFSIKRFVGHGCGKLRKKNAAWVSNLFSKGCSHVVIIHDCDRHDVNVLKSTLLADVPLNHRDRSIIIIPVEEIEAWLISDPLAIQQAMNLSKLPRCPKHPEKIPSPK